MDISTISAESRCAGPDGMESPPATEVGVSYGAHALDFLERHPGVVDYIEIPFEQLRHEPGSISIGEKAPLILHSASLSIAGFYAPPEPVIEAVRSASVLTKTPWIGEHLSFILAHCLGSDQPGDPHDPTSLTFTVCPQLSAETLHRARGNLLQIRNRFQVPLILENPPQYFVAPGSTMSLVEFMVEFFSQCDAGLLLDISHFLITAHNRGFDAATELARLPLERVVEVHLSGFSDQSGVTWDDHGSAAPEIAFELLAQILERGSPRAVTFEYNWDPEFPDEVLREQILRVRDMTSTLQHASPNRIASS